MNIINVLNIYNKLPFSTSSSIELAQFGTKALKSIFIPGFGYKKAGVIVMEFSPEQDIQLSLFENSNSKHILLMKAIDRINLVFGLQKIKLASQN